MRTSNLPVRKKPVERAGAPRYKHNDKSAIYLGQFQDYDLYHQKGHLLARFSDEPTDYLVGVRKRQCDKVPALSEATRLAEQRGLELDTTKEPVRRRLKTSDLLAHARQAECLVECFRFVRTYRKDHTIRVFQDNRVEEGGWETNARDFLRFYPDRLGRIWHLEADGDAEDDDD